jgi:hypothetical protein
LRHPEFFKEKYEFFYKIVSTSIISTAGITMPKATAAISKATAAISKASTAIIRATAAVRRNRRHHSYQAITAILRIVATIITSTNAASC